MVSIEYPYRTHDKQYIRYTSAWYGAKWSAHMARLKAACECVMIDKVWLIRDVHASTISLGVYQGTQLCDLHIMNLKSCSVSHPL